MRKKTWEGGDEIETQERANTKKAEIGERERESRFQNDETKEETRRTATERNEKRGR